MEKKVNEQFKPIHLLASQPNEASFDFKLPKYIQYVLIDIKNNDLEKVYWPVVGKSNIKALIDSGAPSYKWKGHFYIDMDWYKNYLARSTKKSDLEFFNFINENWTKIYLSIISLMNK